MKCDLMVKMYPFMQNLHGILI